MENLDLAVLRQLRDWRRAGRHALLATVVRTWGSSPRPVGSIMALSEDGAVVGSVSGGCIEDDLVDRQVRGPAAAPGAPPRFVTYGVTADEAHRFGLPCGGTLELLLEHDPDAEALDDLVEAVSQGRLVRRAVRVADGAVVQQPLRRPEGLRVADGVVTNTFGPAYRMLLIGAGQLAECLATMALFSGFDVTVCDPREAHRGSWNVPGATLVTGMPDDVVTAMRPDARTCIVALTHDPKLDDLALMEALRSEAFYVGAIGSRRNQASRRERLTAHFGLTDAQMRRLHGPVGVDIGSRTPPEIAVSIMAEVIAVKNGMAGPATTPRHTPAAAVT
jgi:xanthine dehydrogenase accessory factor